MNLRQLPQRIFLFATVALLGACGGGREAEVAPSRLAPQAARTFTPASLPAAGSGTQAASKPQAQTADPLAQQIIDVYDAPNNVLSIPLVQVGTRFYRDVQVTLASLVSVGVAKNTSGVFDRYDVATNQLTIPVLRIESTLYYNVVVTVGSLISYAGMEDSYSVPVDLAQVSYPASYRTITTSAADINNDPCNLDLSKVTYPASWLGQFPLPPIAGAPLKPAIKRSVTLKDVGLQPGNPAFIMNAPGAPAGCTGDLQTALGKTMSRLHSLGADYVNVTQWHWASSNPDGSWFFTPAEQTYGSITDADLAGLVQKAHAEGLKVVVRNQIQGFFPAGHPEQMSVPANTPENHAKWFPAYQAYMAERAGYFQSIGVDVWELGCAVCLFGDSGDGSQASVDLFAAQYAQALDRVKATFTGQILMSLTSWLPNKPDLAARIDIFEIGLYGPPGSLASLDANFTLQAYRDALAHFWGQSAINLLDGFGKTIMITYGIQSRRSMLTLPGYMEETACTAALFGFDAGQGACIQREQLTDFSMQAIVHQATLEYINQLSSTKSTLMVNVLDYWITDSLMPFTAFPNIAFSIRNKPAEGIVKAWFAR